MKIISGLLILITAFLSISHGWSGLSGTVKPEEAKMMADIGLTKPLLSAGTDLVRSPVQTVSRNPSTPETRRQRASSDE